MASPDHGRPLAKLKPPQSPDFRPCVLLETLTCKGLIMEQLEIIDLGDAMTETRCAQVPAMSYDYAYGAGYVHC
jgi:hypothetical protein